MNPFVFPYAIEVSLFFAEGVWFQLAFIFVAFFFAFFTFKRACAIADDQNAKTRKFLGSPQYMIIMYHLKSCTFCIIVKQEEDLFTLCGSCGGPVLLIEHHPFKLTPLVHSLHNVQSVCPEEHSTQF